MTRPGLLRTFLTASGARATNAALAVVRAKLVALLLGPEGVGLLGLYTAAQEIGAQAADAGLSHSAVREVARHRDDPARAARLHRTLAVSVLALATLGALATWMARAPLSRLLTGTDAHAAEFGILALGLFLTVLFRWRQSVLTGLGRVGPLAAGLVAGTALSTAVAAALVWWLGMQGLAWAAVAAPAAGFLALSVGRGPWTLALSGRFHAAELGPLIRIGVSLMLIAQMALIAPMLIRIWLTHKAGLAEAGLFQAAWTISAQAMTVLLTAVAMDFYPRLSALGEDRAAAARCLSDQIRLHLAIGGPVLIAVAGMAPQALSLLYAAEFVPAAPLLQGLMVGGLARLVSAPLETVLTVAGRPRAVLLTSVMSLALLIGGTALGHQSLGIAAIGLASAVAGLVHLSVLVWVARASAGIAPDPGTLLWLGALLAAGAVSAHAPPAAGIVMAAGAFGLPVAWRYRFLGTSSWAGRRSSAALNRLKVWLT